MHICVFLILNKIEYEKCIILTMEVNILNDRKQVNLNNFKNKRN